MRSAFLLLAILPAELLSAGVRYDDAKHIWSLTTRGMEYRLGNSNGEVSFLYFGPEGGTSWPVPKRPYTTVVRYDIAGSVDGQVLKPEFLTLTKQEIRQPSADRSDLVLTFHHKFTPLEVEEVYTTWGDTGVMTRAVRLTNRGDRVLMMESAPSLGWRLPPGEYDLTYLHGTWGEERQVANERIGGEQKRLINQSGRSTNGYSPWFSLQNRTSGIRYAAQLAYSGNWEANIGRFVSERRNLELKDQDLRVELGMRFDGGGAAPLQPGQSFAVPQVAFTACTGDVDDAANQLHRYQRRYVAPKSPANHPPLATFNVWHPLQRTPHAADVMKYGDYAAGLGIEAVIIDSGWFLFQDNLPVFGDWDTNPDEFPHGLRDVADHLHAKGMKFGVWVEIECAGDKSKVAREHPDWLLKYDGVPMPGTRGRLYLDFSKPEVRKWARAVIDRLVQQEKADWLKLDYNVDLGEYFDQPASGRTNTVLYDHLRHYFAFLDEIRKAYPKLILENCSSGGLRMDLGIMSRMDTSWVSDVVDPRRSVQLEYGCTMEFTPGVCNHWTVGDKDDGRINLANPPGWWNFMFRIAMPGEFGISSRVFEWNDALEKLAIGNVALYKRLREITANADVYHLTTPPPAGQHPAGWMALQYSSEDQKRSVVMTFRLEKSEPRQMFRLRGLDPAATYRVSIEGSTIGTFTGAQLAAQGVGVTLDEEWRSAFVEIEAVTR